MTLCKTHINDVGYSQNAHIAGMLETNTFGTNNKTFGLRQV